MITAVISKAMQPYCFLARRGAVRRQALTHSGEEFVYVLTGQMRYHVGTDIHELGPGDSLYFNAEQPHDLEPITATVRFLTVFCQRPPELQT